VKFIFCLNKKKTKPRILQIVGIVWALSHTITWGQGIVSLKSKFDIQGQVKRPKFAWQIKHLPCWILAKEL